MPSELRVRFFGVPSVEWNGAALSVAVRPLCLVLFAMIVLAEPDRRLSRKAVAAELWPDDEEPAAAANLRRHLSFLSAALPASDACIGRDRDALWCPAAAAPWSDVAAFERGELEAYRADFMEGFEHGWVHAQRERFRAAACDGFVRRAETLREDGDDAAAIVCAKRALEIDPTNEAIAQMAIELHGERGDVAAVDEAFALLARRLREIDVEPAPATIALVDRFHRLAREAAARIPRPLTSFVETQALADVVDRARDHRLVTIVGPGGVGKTRLALEAAHRLAPSFTDGAYFVDLSAVCEGDALADALSRALGARADLASQGFAGVQAFLRNRRALLLLDNCEQIIESCSWFLNDALASAPHLHVIATSREAFGLCTEDAYRLPPLGASDAARLLVDRARSAAWDGGGVTNVADRVAAIARRLDGLPLALELAASMLGTLALTDLEQQLSEDVVHLRSRDVTKPLRHRSLADVIAWSVSLMTESERSAFARLSVFAGSFSAEAARTVAATDRALLGALVAKSMLVREDAVEGRFVFLISIGAYARRLRDRQPLGDELRDAHAAFYATLAMRSDALDFWAAEYAWLRAIDRDFANVTQALRATLLEGGASESGLHLAIGLTNYFARRGFFREGVSWAEAALDRATPGSPEHAHVLLCLSILERYLGRHESGIEHARAAQKRFADLRRDRYLAMAINSESAHQLYLGCNAEAQGLLDRALPLARASGDARTEALIHGNVAYLLSLSDSPRARERYLLALRCFDASGDRSGVGRTYNAIAGTDCDAYDYSAANEHLSRALAIQREFDDDYQICGVLSDLGDVAVMRGDYGHARACYAEALKLCEHSGAELFFPYVLSGIAALALESGRSRVSARLLGAARRKEHGPNVAAQFRVYAQARTAAQRVLGVDACAREMRLGRELSRTDAAKLARSVLGSSETT